MKKLISILLIFSVCWCFSQSRVTTQGILQIVWISWCMDNCSEFYLEADPGYESDNITSLNDPLLLMPYVGQHVTITGTEVWCVECGAINVESIEIIPDPPGLTVSRGILWQNSGGSGCMDGCDEFGLDPDEDYLFTWVTTLGAPETLMPYDGLHIEVLGETVTCVECDALQPDYINVLTDTNLITNGSFESVGTPGFSNWLISCFADSAMEAPPGCGLWSLKLESGNTQGCFPGQASTPLITTGQPGEILTVTGWTHQTYAGVGSTIMLTEQGSPATILAQATTDSLDWTSLTFSDTLLVNDDIDLQILLDAGLTGGPMVSWAYFDQIVVQSAGQMQYGDVNGDNAIDVLDIVHMVNIILSMGADASDYELWAGDLNYDGETNILDIVAVINLILN